jgi:hypothetical protein
MVRVSELELLQAAKRPRVRMPTRTMKGERSLLVYPLVVVGTFFKDLSVGWCIRALLKNRLGLLKENLVP